jgi:hypothetical protein
MRDARVPFAAAAISSSASRSAFAATRPRATISIALKPIAASPKATMTITEITP